MNPEVREKWTARLRSGRDQQGRGRLRDEDNKLCCLGVLCEIAVEEGVIPEPLLKPGLGMYNYDGEGSVLPPVVQEWAGMESNRGWFVTEDADYTEAGRSLMSLNDSSLYSFAEIADVIDENGDTL